MKADIVIEDKENQSDLRKLEQMYNNNQVDTMFEDINKQEEKICQEIIEYSKSHVKPTKFDKDGNVISTSVKYNPIVINNTFFKPITTIAGAEPIYTAEKLGLVFDYYCNIVSEVNDKIGYFPSSLTSFCKLAGITLTSLRRYRSSTDINMRVVVDKIYDQVGDTNLTMSQLGILSEKTTIFKMKSQNEITEKEQPKIVLNIVEKPDVNRINERINKYRNYAEKKMGDK